MQPFLSLSTLTSFSQYSSSKNSPSLSLSPYHPPQMARKNFVTEISHKWSKLGSTDDCSQAAENDCCFGWTEQSCFHAEGSTTPRDVPRGHLVVYVGPDHKRYVIKVIFLEHPLFRALLDQARDEYEFSNNSRLCIPCEEKNFLSVVRHIRRQHNRNVWLCF